ncbi:MAG: 4Fe-4S binding protein [Lachnospira sp.]|nr:4Fe-4S binding protein [Lachnospira sp.]
MSRVMKFAPVILKNLFSKPVTRRYPAVPIQYPEGDRGHIEIQIDRCISCGMCVRSCPTGTLSVDRMKGTWTINRFDCVQCGYCVLKCPVKCLSIVPGYQEPEREKASQTYQKSPEVLRAEAEKRAKQAALAKEMAAKKAAALKAKKEAEAAAAAGAAAQAVQSADKN